MDDDTDDGTTGRPEHAGRDDDAPRGGGLTTGEVARRLGVAPTTVR
ncbi:transcriptional regulator, partial [Streptomyces sp. SID9913]|nr:transcriptional regulator [Streptomyces sp. SID9913]